MIIKKMIQNQPRNETHFCYRIIIFLISLTVFCKNVNATSLDKALTSVIDSNSNIKLEKSRLDQVKATKGDAISEFLPDVKATYQRGRQKNDAVGLDRGDLDKMNDQDVKQLNFTQPIFDGFKSYNYTKEIGYNIKSAENYYRFKKDEILLEAVGGYLNLFKARELLKIKTDNAESASKLLKLVEQRNRLGKVGGSEVIKYQTTVSSSISEKLTAKKDLFKAEEEYNKIFGKIDEDLSLPLVVDDKKIPDNKEELKRLAVIHNPNLKSYKFKIKSAQSAVSKSKGEFSPKVELSASMSEQENVTYLNNRNLRSEAVYLNVTVPIFQKGVEYFGVGKANKDLRFAKREYETNRENVLKDLNQTYKEYLFYDDLIKSHDELTELTKSRITKIEEQVKIGRGDVIDLYGAKLELNKILEEGLNHKTDYILSYYKLLMLIGKFEL